MKPLNIKEGAYQRFVNRISIHLQKASADRLKVINKIIENNFYTILLLLAALMFVSQAIIYILFGRTWYDEAGYLYESWLICDQGWIPYRDMYIKLPPVLFYVYGIVQHLFGPSYYIGRLESVIFCALMLFMMFKLSAKIGGKMAGTIAVLLIVSNTFFMRYYSSATAYSLTTLFMMSSLCVFVSDLKNPLKTVISVVLMCLSFLTRQNMAPVLILLILYIILTEKDRKTVYYAISTAIIFPLIIISPFLLMDFENTYSSIFGPMFKPISGLISPHSISPTSITINPYSGVSAWISRLCIITRIGVLITMCQKCYLLFVLLFGVFIVAIWRKTVGEIVVLLRKYKLPVLIGVMFITSFLVHLYWSKTTCDLYLLYSIPLAASFVGMGIAKIYQKIDSDDGRKIFVIILIFSIFLTLASPQITPISNPLKGFDSDIQRIQRAADVVEHHTHPDDKIFTIDDPYYVFLAERTVFPPLTHRLFLYTTSNDTQYVERRHYYNLEMVDRWLSGDADAVIFQSDRWREKVAMELSAHPEKAEVLELIEEKLQENYVLVATIENAYPRKYAAGNGTVEIYLRRNDLS